MTGRFPTPGFKEIHFFFAIAFTWQDSESVLRGASISTSFTVDLLKHLWDQEQDLILDELSNSQLFFECLYFQLAKLNFNSHFASLQAWISSPGEGIITHVVYITDREFVLVTSWKGCHDFVWAVGSFLRYTFNAGFSLFALLILVCKDCWIFSLLIKNCDVNIMASHVAFLRYTFNAGFSLFALLILVCNDCWIFSLLIKNCDVNIMASHVAFLPWFHR